MLKENASDMTAERYRKVSNSKFDFFEFISFSLIIPINLFVKL